MDKIENEDFANHKKVFLVSSGIMLAILQLFIILISNGIDIVNFVFIKNAILRVIMQFSIQIMFFGFVSAIVYNIVFKLEEIIWIKCHRNWWLQGQWLHIHDKANVRIGVVNIKQQFSVIEVHGENISPNQKTQMQLNKTKWDYIDTKFDLTDKIEFVGNYTAMKSNDEQNYGVHIFNDVQLNKDGYPVSMHGKFGDAFKIQMANVEKIKEDKAGEIYLFRLNDTLRRYLECDIGIDLIKLSNITSIPNLRGEKYVQTLEEVLEKHSR